MDQLQCALLGYFGDAIRETGVVVSACEGLMAHPSEAALVDSAIPMAKDYEALAGFRERCASGRVRGFYANSLAAGVGDVLSLYENDVLALTGAHDVLLLRSRYALTFRRLLLVLQCTDVPQRLKLLHALTVEPRLPMDLRSAIGERVSLAVLRNVAHWCAHGEILDPHDFIVVPGEETQEDGSVVQWVADRSKAPPDWPDALLAMIVVAGKERRLLLKGSNDLVARKEMTDVERLKEREGAREVFDSIHDPALIESGAIAVDELTRRVRVAHTRWSKVVWSAVKLTCKLLAQLDTVRDMYLCRRGDVWQTFIEIAGPGALFSEGLPGAQMRGDATSAEARLNQERRSVANAFASAMNATGLADDPLYKPYQLQLRDPPASATAGGAADHLPPTIDAIGAATLGNVRRLALQLRIPPGMSLVVSPNAQRRYVRLFALHIALKLAIFGLNEVRRFAGQVARSHQTSPLLRRVLHLTHTLHFFLSNVAFCLQGDVQDTQYRALVAALKEATAVETARRAHELFMEELYAGAFLLQDGVDVARAVDAAIMLALGMFVYIVRRESTRNIIKASAGSDRRNYGTVVHAENEVHRVLAYIANQVNRRILIPLPPTLSMDTRPAHSALWTRLNFNNWFADTSTSLSEYTASVQEQQQQQQPPQPQQPASVRLLEQPPPAAVATARRGVDDVGVPRPMAALSASAAAALAARRDARRTVPSDVTSRPDGSGNYQQQRPGPDQPDVDV